MGKAYVQVLEGEKLTQKIVETEELTIKEADRRVRESYKESEE